jgi:hypothetical protein
MPRADFLATTDLLAPDIITNAPYDDDLPEKFALHALALGARKVALLCRLQWLTGEGRLERLFSQRKLARVWVCSQRPTLWRGDLAGETDGGQTDYAWVVFEREHDRPMAALGWLPPSPDEQGGDA